MADNKVTIACPICSTGSTKTTTKTDTDSTTTTTNGAPTSPPTNPKVEHGIGTSTAIATASSTSIQHTYDLMGYQTPIQVEGYVEEEVDVKNSKPDVLTHPKRPAHAFYIEGMASPGTRTNQSEGTQKDPLEQAVTLIFNCPVTQQSFQATLMREEQDGPIKVLEVEAISPDKSLLLDVGKQIASVSLKVSSSFCTSMIATSTGAIGVYTALFAIVLPKTCTIEIGYGLLAILPALVFIAAAVGFAFGAFPIDGFFMAADPYSIETYREHLLSIRMSRLRLSFVLFCVAMVLAVIVVVLVTATHVGCTG